MNDTVREELQSKIASVSGPLTVAYKTASASIVKKPRPVETVVAAKPVSKNHGRRQNK